MIESFITVPIDGNGTTVTFYATIDRDQLNEMAHEKNWPGTLEEFEKFLTEQKAEVELR
jgi:hypothetical protein